MKKTVYNENGTKFEFDPELEFEIPDKKTGNIIFFTAEETIDWVIRHKLWDMYHAPFNVLNIRNWIQILKMFDKTLNGYISQNILNLRNEKFELLSDFEIGKLIKAQMKEQN